MTKEEHKMRMLRWERIARVKRLLRLMPRKATLHRYPVLRWFGKAARTRSYLWSFRVKTVIPAIYVGCVLALLPLYGIQLPLAVAFAFLLKANLPVLASLQFITNPVSAVPAYFTAYQVGRAILSPFGFESPSLNMQEMRLLTDNLLAGNWGYNLSYVGAVWLLTALGGFVLGIFLGTIGSLTYRLAAYEVIVFNEKLRKLQTSIRANQKSGNAKEPSSPITNDK